MSYTILNQITQTIVVTTVEYNINGTIVVVDVPHFMPENEQAIIEGIENREITEAENLQNNP